MGERGQHGYAMVALLVGLSVMSVLMTAVMPTWRQAVRREKEAELIFRGQQYARAIGLFQKKSGPGVLPPNLDVLVEQRMLRRKYKDPITGVDFDVLSPLQPVAGDQAGSPTPGGATLPTTTGTAFTAAAGQGRGGVMGVASKSKDASIRIYNGRTHYNEWQFVYVAQALGPPGAPPGGRSGGPLNPPGPGGVGPGGRGRAGTPPGRGQAPPGRGGATPQAPVGPPRR